jgi:hypothetical protein
MAKKLGKNKLRVPKTVLRLPDPGPFQLFPASGLLDKFRIASTEMQKVCLLEDNFPALTQSFSVCKFSGAING